MSRHTSKLAVTQSVRVKVYPLVADAVERGVAHGLARFNKYAYDDSVLKDETLHALQERVTQAVTGELCELFEFDAEPET